MTRPRLAALAALLSLLAALAGCGGSYTVTRIAGGQTIEGRFVPPEAYAAYLRGAIADGSGDAREAERGYLEATRIDPEDPEPWTRLAEVRCRRGASGAAHAALEEARGLDPSYAPMLELSARCSGTEDPARRAGWLRDAAAFDPDDVPTQIEVARLDADTKTVLAARRLFALTAARGVDPAAWRALHVYASAHHDEPLAALAFARLVGRSADAWRDACDLARRYDGEGRLVEARVVGAATLDAAGHQAGRAGSLFVGQPSIVRAAFDEAIARGDEEALERRATVARVPLPLAAARARLLGNDAMAAHVTGLVVAADPSDASAALLSGQLPVVGAQHPIPAVIWALAVDARSRTSPAAARTLAASLPHEPPDEEDLRLLALLADLSLRGVVPPSAIPPGARILASSASGNLLEHPRERGSENVLEHPRERGSENVLEPKKLASLSPGMRLVALALTNPGDAAAMEASARLAGAEDPLIVVARGLVSQASGPLDPAEWLSVFHAAEGDPIASAMAARIAAARHDEHAWRTLRAAAAGRLRE